MERNINDGFKGGWQTKTDKTNKEEKNMLKARYTENTGLRV